MERYICIHAHFYQPPRENPWLETVEQQDSAYPFHDWNERITAECYGPNGASRIVDPKGRISEIVNNYSKISFNFGPTLLSWLEDKSPDVYRSILEADEKSARRFSGHGSAMAQVYNHVILPLANRRDKQTQVRWGIEDFRHRFEREPEGMWLSETAADTETLEVLAAEGIRFTVLSPFQAARVRRVGSRNWREVGGGRVDPSTPYLCRLPSGNSITLFFYDGPISRAVAFEKLLNSGEQFAQRLTNGFSHHREWPELMHIATDGESYGHHHPHGDMALGYALKHVEDQHLARLTNYGEYLEKYPPQFEAQILEATSWSCAHGVERWRGDCGCSSGGHPEWNQHWRGPLRDALDHLRDAMAPLFEESASKFFNDPWLARDEYIRVVLDRSRSNVDEYFADHQRRLLAPAERVKALELLELQRHALLMFTSCGWFFDEVSGIETIQIIAYAGRVLQLAHVLFGEIAGTIEDEFLRRLSSARSNLPEVGDAAELYRRHVLPANVSLAGVAAHYAISSLFEQRAEEVPIYCYDAERNGLNIVEFGRSRMAVGRARICSKITQESQEYSFGVIHFGDHNLSAGVRRFEDDASYERMVTEATAAFARADLAQVIRVLDRHFGQTTYSLKSLFGDERKKVLDRILSSTLNEAAATYRQVYDNHAPLLRYLASNNLKKPPILALTAEFVLNAGLKRELSRSELDGVRIRGLLQQARDEAIALDRTGLGFTLEGTLNALMAEFSSEPERVDLLARVHAAIMLSGAVQLPVNLWRVQNLYYKVAHEVLPGMRELGNHSSEEWVRIFLDLGERLNLWMGPFRARSMPMAG